MTADAPRENRAPAGGSTSRSLLAEAKLADPAAWERLAKLYAPLVAFWCRRWGVADQDIVDVLQDVFSAVASHLSGFRKERAGDTFRGWLLTITRNKTRDYFRRRVDEPCAAGGTEASLRLQQLADPHIENDLPDTARRSKRSAASSTSGHGGRSGESSSKAAPSPTWPPISTCVRERCAWLNRECCCG
jgi:RNA polymerase sigma factor (sigma-70 family)